MNAPRAVLILIWLLEAVVLGMQLHRRQWVESTYWLGVMLINVALYQRSG